MRCSFGVKAATTSDSSRPKAKAKAKGKPKGLFATDDGDESKKRKLIKLDYTDDSVSDET